MELEPARFRRVIVLCTDCEDRGDGPRDLSSKAVGKHLKHATGHAPVKVKLLRSRCMGLCPRKAIAALACGEGLAPMTAELMKEADVDALGRWIAASKPGA